MNLNKLNNKKQQFCSEFESKIEFPHLGREQPQKLSTKSTKSTAFLSVDNNRQIKFSGGSSSKNVLLCKN